MRRRVPPWLRERWLATAVLAVSLLGLPLAYLAGARLARLEDENLARIGYQVSPADVKPFNRLLISGGGLVVRIGCAQRLQVDVHDHPDKVHLVQRRERRLYIAGQQRTSREPFVVDIRSPDDMVHVDIRNGARLELAACAVDPAQLTANLTAGAELKVSGVTTDLYLFGSTGSRFSAGPQGPLVMEQATVDLVFGSWAQLCGVTQEVRGSAAMGSKVMVRPDTKVLDLHDGVVERSCAGQQLELTT